MHSAETRPGGRYLALERGLMADEPALPAKAEEGGRFYGAVPLFPLPEIARIDWQSILSTFPDWRHA